MRKVIILWISICFVSCNIQFDLAKRILEIEKEYVDEGAVKDFSVEKTYDKYNRIFNKAQKKVKPEDSMEDVVLKIYNTVSDDFAFVNTEDVIFSEGINRQVFDCKSLSIFFVCALNRLNQEVFLVKVPQHIIIRVYDGIEWINFDVTDGRFHIDSFFIDRFDISKESIKNKVYLSDLNVYGILSVVYDYLGGRLFDNGKYEKAAEVFNKSIDLNDKNLSAIYNRGLSYGHLNRLKESVESFDLVLSLDPDDFKSYKSRGIEKEKLGDLEGALADYNKSINLVRILSLGSFIGFNRESSKFADSYFQRGRLLYTIGKNEEAFHDFEMVLKHDPEHEDANKIKNVLGK